MRPALIWALLFLGIAAAVFAGVTLALVVTASRPGQTTVAPRARDVSEPRADWSAGLPGAPTPPSYDLPPGRLGVGGGAPLDATPLPVMTADGGVAPSIVPAARSGTRVAGIASWYSAGLGQYAAVPGYRGPETITVCDRPGHCLRLPAITSCGCRVGTSVRVVDLSREAFAFFAPLSRGLVAVTIERGEP